MKSKEFLAGWQQVDITPEKPVCLCGQFYARISEGVKDSITSTIAYFQSERENGETSRVIIISCDLVAVPEEFRKAVIEKTMKLMPDIKNEEVIISATHTHTAPEIGGDILRGTSGMDLKDIYGIELPAMKVSDYIEFASTRIARRD